MAKKEYESIQVAVPRGKRIAKIVFALLFCIFGLVALVGSLVSKNYEVATVGAIIVGIGIIALIQFKATHEPQLTEKGMALKAADEAAAKKRDEAFGSVAWFIVLICAAIYFAPAVFDAFGGEVRMYPILLPKLGLHEQQVRCAQMDTAWRAAFHGACRSTGRYHTLMTKRHQLVEHAILNLILGHGDHQGYANTLPGLASILRQTVVDIDNREIVDTLKRLCPQYLTLWKFSVAHHGFIQYPDVIADDEQFFGRADFCVRRTPHTDPYVQSLALEIDPPEGPPPMTTSISDAGRKARFDRWEKLGLDRVKADLVHNGGRGEVGGTNDVRELAWEWVRKKEAEVATAAKQPTPAGALPLISETRLNELRAVPSTQFDFVKLIRLCEETNTAYSEGCYFATAMLTRGLLDHVPPVFGKRNFSEVANNYGGTKSFREAMEHLDSAAKKVADGHLHTQIRKSETLPTSQQVNFASGLDVLLSEIVRIMQ